MGNLPYFVVCWLLNVPATGWCISGIIIMIIIIMILMMMMIIIIIIIIII